MLETFNKWYNKSVDPIPFAPKYFFTSFPLRGGYANEVILREHGFGSTIAVPLS